MNEITVEHVEKYNQSLHIQAEVEEITKTNWSNNLEYREHGARLHLKKYFTTIKKADTHKGKHGKDSSIDGIECEHKSSLRHKRPYIPERHQWPAATFSCRPAEEETDLREKYLTHHIHTKVDCRPYWQFVIRPKDKIKLNPIIQKKYEEFRQTDKKMMTYQIKMKEILSVIPKENIIWLKDGNLIDHDSFTLKEERS